MGVYIDYSDILAAADEQTIERSTDENSPGNSNQEHVNKLILQRENWFESYASTQATVESLRIAKPEVAKAWIVAAVVYDLYGRRVPPDHVERKYLHAEEILINYSRTGVPPLISSPALAGGGEFGYNMTKEDLEEVMPKHVDSINSGWKYMS